MAAHLAARIFEGGGRLHQTGQAPVPAAPDVGLAVADLGEGILDALEGGDLILLVELVRADGNVDDGTGHDRRAGNRRKRGGRRVGHLGRNRRLPLIATESGGRSEQDDTDEHQAGGDNCSKRN